ncbi:MAG: hypothetical protein F6K42_35230, partial [Leptolyngbya sp. SIO1D8]|nr:hypothetical protein [Leptolyngbya sp. SIO1D8]
MKQVAGRNNVLFLENLKKIIRLCIFRMEDKMYTFFRENLFLVGKENLIPVEPILESLRKSTFACIRGVVSEQEVQCSLNALKNRFNPALDRPSVGEKPSEVKSNFQK